MAFVLNVPTRGVSATQAVASSASICASAAPRAIPTFSDIAPASRSSFFSFHGVRPARTFTFARNCHAMTMSTGSGRGVYSMQITGDGIELTEAIRAYVEEKIGHSVETFKNFVTGVDVHLQVSKNPRVHFTQSAEVTVYAQGQVLRASERTENLYASIDLVSEKIGRNLRKYKEKRQDKHPRAKDSPSPAPGVDEAEVFAAPAPVVVKKKQFPMPAMTVDDALECLGYLDHDFYVFRNKATNEINVVYERHEGGYGLIEPERA
eukprot:tig00021312_g20085.t1